MKKIVIKMRSMKKMVGDDLLKLALMLSLLKVSPVMQHLGVISDSRGKHWPALGYRLYRTAQGWGGSVPPTTSYICP